MLSDILRHEGKRIVKAKADGSAAAPLTELTASEIISFGIDWSPNGAKLAFFSGRAVDGSDAFLLTPDHPLNVDVNSLGSQMAFLKVRQFEGPYGRFRKRFVGEGGQAIADFNGDGTNDLIFCGAELPFQTNGIDAIDRNTATTLSCHVLRNVR